MNMIDGETIIITLLLVQIGMFVNQKQQRQQQYYDNNEPKPEPETEQEPEHKVVYKPSKYMVNKAKTAFVKHMKLTTGERSSKRIGLQWNALNEATQTEWINKVRKI